MPASDMSPAAERHRLLHGPPHGFEPEGLLVRRIARGGASPDRIAERMIAILLLINEHSTGEWPADERWPAILPRWFTAACAPPSTREQAEAQLARWRAASPAEQARMSAETPWELDNWLYQMQPDQRQWTWWGHSITADGLEVILQVDGLPTATGSLVWLLRASGAATVEYDG